MFRIGTAEERCPITNLKVTYMAEAAIKKLSAEVKIALKPKL